MPCLVHLQCSSCCLSQDSAGATGPGFAAKMLTHNRRLWPDTAGWCHASKFVRQRDVSSRAVQGTADELRLAERPERPSRVDQAPSAEPQTISSSKPPAATRRFQSSLPAAPLVSPSDRAPPQRQRVYWRGSVTSREAVLGRRLLSSNGQASVASVLQGEMLSSKQITRRAYANLCFASTSGALHCLSSPLLSDEGSVKLECHKSDISGARASPMYSLCGFTTAPANTLLGAGYCHGWVTRATQTGHWRFLTGWRAGKSM